VSNLEREVFFWLGWYSCHEVMCEERTNHDGALARGPVLARVPVEVQWHKHHGHLAQLVGAVRVNQRPGSLTSNQNVLIKPKRMLIILNFVSHNKWILLVNQFS